MIRIKCIPVLMTLAILTACGSKDEKTTPEVPAAGTTPPPAQLQPLPVKEASSTPNTTNTALNPEHGQPGHRCDIAVGAPLNSPPAQPAAVPAQVKQTIPQQTVQTPAPSLNTTTPSKGVLNGGVNPAHGQPGHRCDIAVGAPLNSKPAN